MSSSDFRQIAERSDHGRKERLFRAAVTAFCSLTRPSRNEIGQLEDLALPLYDSVSVDAKRFVAAALSEAEYPPPALVRRLADESVDIAAPLLLRSAALADVDLIAVIGRHGLGHARVIARRPRLNPAIARLVDVLGRSESRPQPAETGAEPTESQMRSEPKKPAEVVQSSREELRPGAAAETVRESLRAMMRPAAPDREPRLRMQNSERPDPFPKLRDTALTGVRAFFETALADALGIDFRQAQTIAGQASFADLLRALRYLGLSEERAFVIVAALHPQRFGHGEAVRLFLERYRLIHPEAAAESLRGWKAASLAAMRQSRPESPADRLPANNPGRPDAAARSLRASSG